MNTKGVVIRSVASTLGSLNVCNDDLKAFMETSDEWIYSRTGIRNRCIADSHETVNQLSSQSAQEALQLAKLAPTDLDLIICATSIPDELYPSTACQVQASIGANNAVAFNVVAACSGFIFAMKIAYHFLQMGVYRRALILGCDMHSRFLDWNDRSTAILFGDASGAMILESTHDIKQSHIQSVEIYSDGTQAKELSLAIPGAKPPFVKEYPLKSSVVEMNGREIYRFAMKTVPEAIKNALDHLNLSMDDVDYVILHQANKRMIDSIAQRLGLNPHQMIVELENFGNTSSASLPLALSECIRKGQMNFPATVVMVGFGAGLTWGVSIVQFNEPPAVMR